MFAISSIILLIVVSFCHGISDRQCPPDTVDFATKVDKSTVVVYGKAMAKIMNEGSDSIFHVFFQVDCILKGPATLRQINITNAGRVEGKKYCQEFHVGRGYSIAFLEPISFNKTDHKTFIPADFVEMQDEGNSTAQLLARTCTLHRLVPRQSIASVLDVCPAVAIDPICRRSSPSTTVVTTTIIPAINTTKSFLLDMITNISNKSVIIPAAGVHSHPIHTPQQEIDAIRGKSAVNQVNVDEPNGAQAMTFNALLMIVAIYFCSYLF